MTIGPKNFSDNFSSTVKEKNEFIKFYGQFNDIHEKYPEIGDEYKRAVYSYTLKLGAIVLSNSEFIIDKIYNIDNHTDLENLEKKYFSEPDIVRILPNDAILNIIKVQKRIITLEVEKKKTQKRIKTLEADRKKIPKKIIRF